MKRLVLAVSIAAAASSALAQAPQPSNQPDDQPIYTKFQDLKWQKLMPELGDRSPESAVLHADAKTQATQMMLRVPKNFHLAQHWHSATEALTVVHGAFIFHDPHGNKEELGPGSFIYIPRKTVHEAWTKPDEGALLFIAADGGFDVNWIEAPPAAAK
jgi:quercetin dioxygenase-like cupin family protein